MLLAVALLLQAITVGLSDDEAYYWVLGQSPAWGYAFHPPGIGWSVWIFQFLFSWLFGANSVFLTRLPAILYSVAIFTIAMKWLQEATGNIVTRNMALIVIGFSGFFSLCWMIVPDLPLFLGWTIAFYASWKLIKITRQTSASQENAQLLRRAHRALGLMCLGITVSMFGKISGIFVASSCAGVYLLLGPKKHRIQVLTWVTASVLIGILPYLIWNANHQWGSLLYQLHDRHQGSRLSLIRYLRFWAIELLAAGPVLFIFAWYAFQKGLLGFLSRVKSGEATLYQFVLLWALPSGLVYLTQPLFSDFKPHWAFIVWWPLVLGMAASNWKDRNERWIKIHKIYGLTVIGFVLIFSHVPLGNLAVQMFSEDGVHDPRLDVTNDFYGWNGLRDFLLAKDSQKHTVLGSRYQTAAQAAFSLGKDWPVTMIPRDEKAKDEWPEFDVTAKSGPEWPPLLKTAYYVADNRYNQGPQFPQTVCVSLGAHETYRFGLLAKSISVWRCEPLISRP